MTVTFPMHPYEGLVERRGHVFGEMVRGSVTVRWADPSVYRNVVGPSSMTEILSDGELESSRRFVFEDDRVAYTTAHHLARCMLGEHLDTHPGSLRFRRERAGKPMVVTDVGPVQFSISHTRGMVACAVTSGDPVGVDVEGERPLGDVASLANGVLTASEAAAVTGRPERLQTRSFLAHWTAKEAYVKAIGKGLSFPLDAVEILWPQDRRSTCGPALRLPEGEVCDGVQLTCWEAGDRHLCAVVVLDAEQGSGLDPDLLSDSRQAVPSNPVGAR